jgi:DNA invertase Pin-like site-specific DNA recombinase
MKNFIYLRTSSAAQDEKSQLIGIRNYLEINQLLNPITFQDKITGSTPWRDRQLMKILEMADKNDSLIVSEISRIGRSTADVLNFLECAIEKGLVVHAVKNNIKLDDSIQSTIFATVLGLAAEIEREFIKSRTREGMARARERGMKLGRPVGAAKSHKTDKFNAEINRLLAAEISQSAIARLLDVSRGTIIRHINRQGAIK